MEFGLTILALTHTNKGKHDDDISKISGSEGMAGGTDGNWVLTKSKRTDTTSHERILEALRARDTETAVALLRKDIACMEEEGSLVPKSNLTRSNCSL